MKKVLLAITFLFSGLSHAQEVSYSLTEVAVRLLQSSAITPSGKVFMASYFETLSESDVDMEVKMELSTFSKMICEEADLYKTQLFFSPKENCPRDLIQFFTSIDKGGEISASGSSTIGPDGKPVTTISVGIKVTW